jgi:hypothetical protein
MSKAVLVIAYEIPEDVDESYAKTQRIADDVRDTFKDESDIQIYMAVRESADAVVEFFKDGG